MGIIISPFLWRSILARYNDGIPLALACGAVAAGTFLPIVFHSNAGLFLSALLFGIAVFIGPSAVTNFSRKNLPKENWRSAISLFTVIFAVGQSIGPIAAGFIGDYFDNIGHGMFAAGIILVLGMLAASRQKKL